MSNPPIPTIPVLDVDQAFPLLTSDGTRRDRSAADGAGDTGPTVEAALRDVLGWRPRAQDTDAFTSALAASFQLSTYEGHVISTYSPRGYAMQADLGAVTGGQASLYTRAVAARSQMLTLLDGLTPLRPDADKDDCEAFRSLCRNAVSALVDELGTPGGPRVAVVDAYLRQLLGSAARKSNAATLAKLTADDVEGQLGALRTQFGLEDAFVNDVDEEGIRTAFWTLVDLARDTAQSWQSLRSQFTGRQQHGFLGTQLVLMNQLLSATAEQVDEVEATLDSVSIGAAERQTIPLRGRRGLTLDGLLTWVRHFVTHEGPRIARDSGRDGITTSFTPTILDILDEVRSLSRLSGRRTVDIQQATQSKWLSATPQPADDWSLQLPLIVTGTRLPAGLQASRSQIAISGLSGMLERLADIAMRISRYPGVVFLDAAVWSPSNSDTVVAIRGLNIRDALVPMLRDKRLRNPQTNAVVEVRPIDDRTTFDTDTLTAVFEQPAFQQYLADYDAMLGKQPAAQPSKALPSVPLMKALSGGQRTVRIFAAKDLPLALRDGLTGRRVRGVVSR